MFLFITEVCLLLQGLLDTNVSVFLRLKQGDGAGKQRWEEDWPNGKLSFAV